MEINVFNQSIDGLMEMKVRLYEYTDNKGKSIDITVWVPESDSRAELEKSARQAAADQLRRALSALENEGPQ